MITVIVTFLYPLRHTDPPIGNFAAGPARSVFFPTIRQTRDRKILYQFEHLDDRLHMAPPSFDGRHSHRNTVAVDHHFYVSVSETAFLNMYDIMIFNIANPH